MHTGSGTPDTLTNGSTTMNIIGVVAGKGGVGKTTIAVNVAARLAHRTGRHTLLVDADSQDAASAAWYLRDTAGDQTGIDVSSYTPDATATREVRDAEFAGMLRQLPAVDRWDWCVIDTIPFLDSPVVEATVEAADYLLLPTKLASGDVARLVQTITGVVRPAGVPFGVVLSEVDPRVAGEAAAAVEALAGIGAPVIGQIRAYVTIRRAWARGLVAGQFEGGGADQALADFDALTDQVIAGLEGNPPAAVDLGAVVGE